ncbi:hypothetical protein BJV74DRAFT_136024 [Russula compacta]|nr:hypothetical protein BJV74DRAFT_136024 [Russula compacta]
MTVKLPPRLLTPCITSSPIMSDVEYTLWCLIEGDTTPFKVKALSRSDINDLKKVIKGEKGNLLQTFDAGPLILWKPKKDISVASSRDLAQCNRDEGQDFEKFAEKLGLATKVGAAFNRRSEASNPLLDIIVQFPIPSKKRKREPDYTPAKAFWNQFRQTWWGDPRGQVRAFRDRNAPSHFLHVEHVEARASFNLDHSDLFVCEEYLLLAERCRNVRRDTNCLGCLILGQPGVGKTLFLLFLLIDCLGRQEVVLFTNDD